MCRLFGLSAAPNAVSATFWLMDAPDSLVRQSRREPDGVGLGVFEANGTEMVHRRPVAAFEDREYAKESRELTGTTFIAHVRYASTGELRDENTHPFAQDGRLFAHNGVVEDLDKLRAEVERVLGAPADTLVHGETDSELVFALITGYARQDGDVTAAIRKAVGWVGANCGVFAVNLILTTPTELWALRYPETHELFVLDRPPGGSHGNRHLEHASAAGTVRVRSGDLANAPATVIASERMDEDPRWRPLEPGELLHVDANGQINSHVDAIAAPAHPLGLSDLHPGAAASQAAAHADG